MVCIVYAILHIALKHVKIPYNKFQQCIYYIIMIIYKTTYNLKKDNVLPQSSKTTSKCNCEHHSPNDYDNNRYIKQNIIDILCTTNIKLILLCVRPNPNRKEYQTDDLISNKQY